MLENIVLNDTLRREHLTDEDIRKNKAFVENLTKIGNPGIETQLEVSITKSDKVIATKSSNEGISFIV